MTTNHNLESANLDDFATDAYFDKHTPKQWHKGRFSQFCYALPGFPESHNKKRFARLLWENALAKQSLSEDPHKRDRAQRLLLAEKVHVGNSTNFTITGGSVTNVVGTLNQEVSTASAPAESQAHTQPPQPQKAESKAPDNPPPRSKRKSRSRSRPPIADALAYDGEISSTPSPPRPAHAKRPPVEQPSTQPPPLTQTPTSTQLRKKARCSAPPPGPPPLLLQSARQQLLYLKQTFIRDIRTSLAETHIRCAQLENKLQEVIDDPVLVEADYMLTEKDETADSEAETVIDVGKREQL